MNDYLQADGATREALRVILDAIEHMTEYGEVFMPLLSRAGDGELSEYGQELETALAKVRKAQGGN
jgi:hypothetical protein